MKLIVASRNPVKLKAVRMGFEQVYPGISIDVAGVEVPTGVSNQPFTDTETLIGAENRARAARAAKPDADFWIGIEGGIEDIPGEGMIVFAWIVILTSTQIGKGKTGGFFIPPEVAQLVREGKELGEADDIFFGRTNSKQKNGAVGILTGDLVDRTSLYVDAVIFALIPHLHPDLYPVNR